MNRDKSSNFHFAALVPMKGHSERVPNKNMRLFNGKPLFYWIIKTLYKCKYVSDVFVDTDSKKIADSCRDFFPNVNIIDRPINIQGDFVSMNNIIEYDLSQIDGYQYFLQTHSTNPLIKAETINKAVEVFMSTKNKDSLFTVNTHHSRFYDYEFKPVNHDPEVLIRTQDLKPLYEENSCLYLFSRKSFNKVKRRIGSRPILFPISSLESVDIDTPHDFTLAELLLKKFK